VSGGGRYRREHGEEPMVTYWLGPTKEVKVALGGCAWRCALRREKRVSAVAAGAEENDDMASCGLQRGDDAGGYRWR
jgi:hypothetical protein